MVKPHRLPARPVEWVAASELHKIFNAGRYYEKVQSGELKCFPDSDRPRRHHAPPSEPVCTWSETWFYYDKNGDPVAVVHQYVRPDGNLGASGLPDPKCLFLQDKVLKLKRRPDR